MAVTDRSDLTAGIMSSWLHSLSSNEASAMF